MKPDEFRQLERNLAEAKARRRERLGLGGFQPEIAQQKAIGALDRKPQRHQARGGRLDSSGPVLRIALINFRHRILDRDNYIGGCKPIRDAIARWLNLDDADKIIEWEYSQHQTNGRQGMVVTLEKL